MPPQQQPLIEVRNLRKTFGSQEVLSSVNLTVPRASVATILGKSGTGKSVLLKCLAGILKPDSGEILFDGQPLDHNSPATLAQFRQRTSYLFQHNALFDSLTALENVALPLAQTTRLPGKTVTRRALEALHQLELAQFAKKYPSQMSGGMQKRLALARAIVTSPELVLFDEPTAGLDPVRRNAVFELIVHLQRSVHFTAIIVTHDINEALVASDTIALLDSGQMHFQGLPSDFSNSTDSSVISFRDNLKSLNETISQIRSTTPATPPSSQ